MTKRPPRLECLPNGGRAADCFECDVDTAGFTPYGFSGFGRAAGVHNMRGAEFLREGKPLGLEIDRPHVGSND
jgi:hypothetical protein